MIIEKYIGYIVTLVCVILSGILIPIAIYLIKKRNKRRYFNLKFLENKNRIQMFCKKLRELLTKNNSWDSKAFNDSDISYKDYLEMLEKNLKIEYSDAQFEALKKKRLTNLEIDEYTQKLKVQEDIINSLQSNLDTNIMRF